MNTLQNLRQQLKTEKEILRNTGMKYLERRKQSVIVSLKYKIKELEAENAIKEQLECF